MPAIDAAPTRTIERASERPADGGACEPQDLYVVINSKVYDATTFVDEHPYGTPLPRCSAPHTHPLTAPKSNPIQSTITYTSPSAHSRLPPPAAMPS